jgi:hypothetical protein
MGGDNMIYRELSEVMRLEQENATLRRARELDKRYGIQKAEEAAYLRKLNEQLETENFLLREVLRVNGIDVDIVRYELNKRG